MGAGHIERFRRSSVVHGQDRDESRPNSPIFGLAARQLMRRKYSVIPLLASAGHQAASVSASSSRAQEHQNAASPDAAWKQSDPIITPTLANS
jgi:hypothetical protein